MVDRIAAFDGVDNSLSHSQWFEVQILFHDQSFANIEELAERTWGRSGRELRDFRIYVINHGFLLLLGVGKEVSVIHVVGIGRIGLVIGYHVNCGVVSVMHVYCTLYNFQLERGNSLFSTDRILLLDDIVDVNVV